MPFLTLQDVAVLDDAVLAHVRASGHTDLGLSDDFGKKLVGIICWTCDAGWCAPRPSSMCEGRVKELRTIYQTLDARNKHLTHLIQNKNPPVDPKSVWDWIRKRDGVGW